MRVLSDPLLAQSVCGDIVLCSCCDRPVVRFGEARVTLEPEQLRQMLAAVREVSDAAGRPGACWGWALRTRTPHEDVTFWLTPDSAAELAGLLEAASAVLHLDAMLADVLEGEPQ